MITLFALFIIAAILLVIYGYNIDEAKHQYNHATPEVRSAWVAIKRAHLNAKDIQIEEGGEVGEPSVNEFAFCALVALIAAMVGLPVTSLIFTVLFGCFFADFLETMKDMELVRHALRVGDAYPAADAAGATA